MPLGVFNTFFATPYRA